MIKTTPLIIVALTAIVLTGCGSKKNAYQPVKATALTEAKVETGNEAVLYPLEKGKSWVYKLDSTQVVGTKQGGGSTEVTFRVSDSQTTGGVTKAKIDIFNKDGIQIDRQTWQVDKTGIYQASSGMKNLAFTPIQAAIKFPINKSDVYKWKGSCPSPFGTLVTGEWQSRNVGIEAVDAVNHQYSAYVFDAIGVFKIGKGVGTQTSRTWFAPGVGMVRANVLVEAGNQKLSLVLKLIPAKVGK